MRLHPSGSSSDGNRASSLSHDHPSESATARLGVTGSRARPLLQLGGMDWDSGHATAEWLQTVDINVIQPTPNISPCSSMRSGLDQNGAWDPAAQHLRSGSASEQALEVNCDSIFLDTIDDKTVKHTSHSIRHSTPTHPIAMHNKSSETPSFLGLPIVTHLSGSCEKLVMQPIWSTNNEKSDNSLHASSSIEEDPHVASFTVRNVRRTHSATNNGNRNDSMKAYRNSPVKRAESENNPLKRCSSSDPRKNSSGSTSSTDEASESVSFHLMVPQLSIDCPSQDVSRASSPSLSPSPPESPRHRCPAIRSRVSGTEGRGVLRRQLARDLTQPCQLLPIYPEEEETLSALSDFVTIRPPPGYRDPSPSLLTTLPFSLSPSPTQNNSFPFFISEPMSPIPPPPSPLYTNTTSPVLHRAHSPVRRTDHQPHISSIYPNIVLPSNLKYSQGYPPKHSRNLTSGKLIGVQAETGCLQLRSQFQPFSEPKEVLAPTSSSRRLSAPTLNPYPVLPYSPLRRMGKSASKQLAGPPSSRLPPRSAGGSPRPHRKLRQPSHPQTQVSSSRPVASRNITSTAAQDEICLNAGESVDENPRKSHESDESTASDVTVACSVKDKASRQRSFAAMVPISIDIPDDVPDIVHETSC